MLFSLCLINCGTGFYFQGAFDLQERQPTRLWDKGRDKSDEMHGITRTRQIALKYLFKLRKNAKFLFFTKELVSLTLQHPEPWNIQAKHSWSRGVLEIAVFSET